MSQTETSLIDQAMSATGLSDFGEHHEFRTGLRVLIAAAEEEAMRTWLEHPAQHMSAVKFTLADFGLTADQVKAGFGDYSTRFGHLF